MSAASSGASGEPTLAEVCARVDELKRKLDLRRVQAAVGCISRAAPRDDAPAAAAADTHPHTPGHSQAPPNGHAPIDPSFGDSSARDAFADAASAAEDGLLALCNLDGEEVEVTNNLQLCPVGKSFSRVNKNFMAPKIFKQDPHTPYFGERNEDIEASERVAREMKEEGPDEDLLHKNREIIDKVKKSRFKRFVSELTDKDADNSDVEGTMDPSGKTYYPASEGVWDRAHKRMAVFDCMLHYGIGKADVVEPLLAQVLNIPVAYVLKYFANAVFRSCFWAVEDQFNKTIKEHKEILTQSIQNETPTCTSEILKSDSVVYFWCRRCKIFDCTLHGPNKRGTVPYKPTWDGSRKDSFRTNSNSVEKKAAIEATCQFSKTEKCYFTSATNGVDAMEVDTAPQGNGTSTNNGGTKRKERVSDAGISVVDLNSSSDEEEEVNVVPVVPVNGALFQDSENSKGVKMLIEFFCVVFGDDPCRLAMCVNLVGSAKVTCTDVGKYVNEVLKADEENANLLKGPPQVKAKKGARCRSKFFMHRDEQDLVKEDGMRFHYTPCAHEGPCNKDNCSCVQNKVICEKYCKCASPRVSGATTWETPRCANSVPYCSCKSSGCTVKACNCFGGKRECDPDFCKCDPKICRNQGLRNGDTKRVVCGHSDIQGWGAFAAEPIKKGELIGEYTGEYIDFELSQKIEAMYNESRTSYLFGLSQQYDVDATRVGNKLRFLNHSTRANCRPTILRVDGDVRVGLYAERDIHVFEELLFDYGKSFRKVLRSKKNGKKPKRRAIQSGSSSNAPVAMNMDEDDE